MRGLTWVSSAGGEVKDRFDMRALSLVLLCLLGFVPLPGKEKPATTYQIPLPPKPDFSALDWLLGEWTGRTTERSPEGEIHMSVSFGLEGRFMIFREQLSLAATKTAPASKESWMGILSPGPSGAVFILRTFSSTGFVSRYRVSVQGGEIDFSPEGGDQPPPGWLFRRVVERSGDGEIKETVQVAPPHKAFFEYYSAKLTRAPHS